ncbi:hypothetical protein [Solibacillus sp. FSL H8-0538]
MSKRQFFQAVIGGIIAGFVLGFFSERDAGCYRLKGLHTAHEY